MSAVRSHAVLVGMRRLVRLTICSVLGIDGDDATVLSSSGNPWWSFVGGDSNERGPRPESD